MMRAYHRAPLQNSPIHIRPPRALARLWCTVSGQEIARQTDLLALNAPKDKLTVSLAYRGRTNTFNGEVRMRHTGGFPVNTSVYVGLGCIGGGGEACVRSYTLFDLLLGHALPIMPGASAQLAITNLFNEGYRSFVGVPTVGRLALLRLRYDF